MRCDQLRGFGPVGTNGPQPVDVLAVLRAATAKANAKASGPTRRMQLDMHEAEAVSAAVAELIEAATGVTAEVQAERMDNERLYVCIRALRAALARCGAA